MIPQTETVPIPRPKRVQPTPVLFRSGPVTLEGALVVPDKAKGLIIVPFAAAFHRDRKSTRQITSELQEGGFATFAVDLLTADEEQIDSRTDHYRLNVPLLTGRLISATCRLNEYLLTFDLPVVYWTTGVTAAAAFFACKKLSGRVIALVSYEGAPELAAPLFPEISVPTLLMLEEDDVFLAGRNREALRQLKGEKELLLLPGDRDLGLAARVSADWLSRHLETPSSTDRLEYRGEKESEKLAEPCGFAAKSMS